MFENILDPETWKTWVFGIGANILKAILTFIIAFFIIKFIDKALSKLFDRTEWDEALENFLHSLIKAVLWIIVFLVILTIFNVDIGPMLASLGIAGFVLGFALKDTLGNLASGVMLMIYKPFKVGHYVEVSGQKGTVTSIGISATLLVTPDNKNVIIPNSGVWGAPITNYSANKKRRLDITVGISYSDDIGKAMKVADMVIKSDKRILTDPESLIAVENLGDSSVDILSRFWVNKDNYWPVKFDFTREIKEAFDKAKISIPFPQRDIHMVASMSPSESSDFGTKHKTVKSKSKRTKVYEDD